MSTDTTNMTTATRFTTGEELLAMGDIGPCELIAGRIVPMTPAGGAHGSIVIRLGRHLDIFAEEHNLGWVTGGETGIYTRRNPDTVRGVDIAFFSRQRLPDGLPHGYINAAPELVVEVLSPTDRWSAVHDKIAEYFAIGVERVWVIVPRQRAVFVYRSVSEWQQLSTDETLKGEGVLEGFTMPVAHLFALD